MFLNHYNFEGHKKVGNKIFFFQKQYKNKPIPLTHFDPINKS